MNYSLKKLKKKMASCEKQASEICHYGRFLPPGKKFQSRGAKTAPLDQDYKLCANYETMFSDTRPRTRFEKRRNPKPRTPSFSGKMNPKVEDMKQIMEVQGSHRTLFYRQPSRKHYSSYATVVVDLENVKGSSRKVKFESGSDPSMLEGISKKEKSTMVITLPAKSEKMITKATQTDFRESEAQTLPWKHEIKAEGKILAELMALDWFDLERNFPPGMEEVTLIEKARQKLAWENVIERMTGKGYESRRRVLVAGLAAAETAFREKKMEEIHRERLNMSERMMKEAREKFKERLLRRLQRSYSSRRMENDERIDYWKHQLTRKLRKMKTSRKDSESKTEKTDIIAVHLDKTSELYAPKLRDGENPSRGHEVIDIKCRFMKRFHGLSILEKYLARILQPRFFGFNYEEASKPRKIELCWRKYRGKAITASEEFLDLPSLKIPVPAPTPEPPPTPTTTKPRSDSEEDLYQASLLLARLIKGRAIQTKKFLEFSKMASE